MGSFQCMICGYDLTGNQSGVCPECGEALDSARFRHYSQILRSVQPHFLRTLIAAGCTFCVGLTTVLEDAAFIPILLIAWAAAFLFGLGPSVVVLWLSSSPNRRAWRAVWLSTCGWLLWPAMAFGVLPLMHGSELARFIVIVFGGWPVWLIVSIRRGRRLGLTVTRGLGLWLILSTTILPLVVSGAVILLLIELERGYG